MTDLASHTVLYTPLVERVLMNSGQTLQAPMMLNTARDMLQVVRGVRRPYGSLSFIKLWTPNMNARYTTVAQEQMDTQLVSIQPRIEEDSKSWRGKY